MESNIGRQSREHTKTTLASMFGSGLEICDVAEFLELNKWNRLARNLPIKINLLYSTAFNPPTQVQGFVINFMMISKSCPADNLSIFVSEKSK